jgi:uncharacterized protein (DUF2384 family)
MQNKSRSCFSARRGQSPGRHRIEKERPPDPTNFSKVMSSSAIEKRYGHLNPLSREQIMRVWALRLCMQQATMIKDSFKHQTSLWCDR